MIIAKVPLHDRLQNCSIVSRKLHRAAAAATTELVVRPNAAKQRSLQLYIANHGQHLTSLEALFLSPLEQLPCHKLQQLQLHVCAVQLGPSNSPPGILQGCTALTELELLNCAIIGPEASLLALAALPQLQNLRLSTLTYTKGLPTSAAAHNLAMPSTLLLQVPRLTHLQLGVASGRCLQGCLQHLSSLTGLQQLNLKSIKAAVCSPSTMPAFSALTALTSIRLTGCALDPAVLHDSTQIQALRLQGVTIVGPEGGTLVAPRLLSCIARMPRLKHLVLDLEAAARIFELNAYTALTASSKLQQLRLVNNNLPCGVWQAMFPAQQAWPNLKVRH